MLRSILGTAALLAGWSVLWFVNVALLGAHLTNGGTICRPECDDSPRDVAIWVLGIVAIVAFGVWLGRRRTR